MRVRDAQAGWLGTSVSPRAWALLASSLGKANDLLPPYGKRLQIARNGSLAPSQLELLHEW